MKKVSLVFLLLVCVSLACGELNQAATEVAQTRVVQTQNAPTPADTATSAPELTSEPQPTEVPPTETPSPAGESRDNPAAFGATVDIGGDVTLTIADVVRPADDVVSQGNQFNKKPEAGQEYMQVNVKLTCSKSSNDTCSFLHFSLKSVGSDGNIVTPGIVTGVEGQIDSGEFFGGSTKEGAVFYLVTQGDDKTVLFYDRIFGDPVYFSVTK